MDVTNDTAGAPVRAVDDGVVVKVEQDELASVDVLNIGRCGRYVVIKHNYPDGHAVFTRYAQLDRIVGSDGRPVAPGSRVTKAQQIGEVGSRMTMHFEIRPVDPKTMEQGAGWTARYGGDPTMEWSRYQAVDPRAVYPDIFGKTYGSQK
jgi:murein DD-endopeptidase MepM/ murein hydrolase activator NlpD